MAWVYINLFVPNKRAKGQRLVQIPMDQKFVEEMDACAKKGGYSDRSKFVRDAVYEKMERMEFAVVRKLSQAPSRFGKGGINYGKSSEGGTEKMAYKDDGAEISFAEESPAKTSAIAAVDKVLAALPKLKPSSEAGVPISQKYPRGRGSARRSKSLPPAQAQAQAGPEAGGDLNDS